jgi:O-antigen/teichoic acid export membrane protein
MGAGRLETRQTDSMNNPSSRGMIRSMLIIASAQAVNVLISVFRMKILAVLLGPSGVGLLAIYNNLQTTASTAAGLGMRSSGVRQIASAKNEELSLRRVRVVLFTAHLVQGLVAMAAIWLFRERLSILLLGTDARSTEVGLVGVAVLLTLIGSSQTALLQGMRRIGDLGRVTVLGALAGTIAGLGAVWLSGEDGLIWFVLVQPLTAVLVALAYTRKLPALAGARLSLFAIWSVWRPMAALGAVFMLASLTSSTTLLLVRGRVSQELGLGAAGLFAASWGITMQYVGFLLNAVSADYYPRLTEVIGDRASATRLMNEQIQLCLALGGPVLLLLIGLAPWMMTLLYSHEFASAAAMLQWQTIGNVFKLASWPLSFAFIASARAGVYLFVETIWNALFLGFVWFGVPLLGLTVAGTAFLAAYVVYFAALSLLVRRLHDFRWEPLSLRLVVLHAILSFTLFGVANIAPVTAGGASIALGFVTGVMGLRLIVVKVGTRGRIASRAAAFFSAVGWPVPARSASDAMH